MRTRAFTIIELLVVVSIIALLIGILLPAIGKARDQAKLTQSQGNLRNLGAAHETYGSEWNDRQFTLIVDELSRYGDSAASAMVGFHTALGGGCNLDDNRAACHPGVVLGWGRTLYEQGGSNSRDGYWGYWMNWNGNFVLVQPIVFGTNPFAAYRFINCGQFNQYVTGRFYDPVFYPAKDTVVLGAIDACIDTPDEFTLCGHTATERVMWSGYILSPAAMYSPDVFGDPERDGRYFTDPWEINGGHRSPSVGQCTFPNLKTRMLEHHWLQNPRGDCNPGFSNGSYDGCEPYYFNHGWESVPVTLFYDGHIEGLGTREASQDNLRVLAQTGGPDDGHGLWSIDTPFGGDYADRSDGGYFMDLSYDWTSTSYHILTLDGIRGRDKLDK